VAGDILRVKISAAQQFFKAKQFTLSNKQTNKTNKLNSLRHSFFRS